MPPTSSHCVSEHGSFRTPGPAHEDILCLARGRQDASPASAHLCSCWDLKAATGICIWTMHNGVRPRKKAVLEQYTASLSISTRALLWPLGPEEENQMNFNKQQHQEPSSADSELFLSWLIYGHFKAAYLWHIGINDMTSAHSTVPSRH